MHPSTLIVIFYTYNSYFNVNCNLIITYSILYCYYNFELRYSIEKKPIPIKWKLHLYTNKIKLLSKFIQVNLLIFLDLA